VAKETISNKVVWTWSEVILHTGENSERGFIKNFEAEGGDGEEH